MSGWFQKKMEAFYARRAPKGVTEKRLGHREIYIVPRRQGFLFLGFILLLLILAINFQNPLVHLLLFWLLSLLGVSMIFSWRNILGLRLFSSAASAIFAGDNAKFNVVLEGRERHHMAIGLGFGRSIFVKTDLKKGERRELSLFLDAPERGLLEMPRLRIESHYPFGFFKVWSYVWLDESVLCYPMPVESEKPPLRALNFLDEKESGQRVTEKEGIDDFDELVRYTPGHSLRRIDWQAYAKGQGLYVKSFVAEEGTPNWYHLADYSGGTEAALSKLCYHILKAEEQGEQYGAVIGKEVILPSRGEAHLTHILTALALY